MTALDKLILANSIECIKNVNNSIAAMDLISSLVDFMFLKCSSSLSNETNWQSKLIGIIKDFLDNLETCVYNDGISSSTEENGQQASAVPFLECLNQINGGSFMHLLDQIFAVLKSNVVNPELTYTSKTEILYRFLGKLNKNIRFKFFTKK
jgi:hypothetical protein